MNFLIGRKRGYTFLAAARPMEGPKTEPASSYHHLKVIKTQFYTCSHKKFEINGVYPESWLPPATLLIQLLFGLDIQKVAGEPSVCGALVSPCGSFNGASCHLSEVENTHKWKIRLLKLSGSYRVETKIVAEGVPIFNTVLKEVAMAFCIVR